MIKGSLRLSKLQYCSQYQLKNEHLALKHPSSTINFSVQNTSTAKFASDEVTSLIGGHTDLLAAASAEAEIDFDEDECSYLLGKSGEVPLPKNQCLVL